MATRPPTDSREIISDTTRVIARVSTTTITSTIRKWSNGFYISLSSFV